jgi:nitrate reductase NapE component
MFLKTVCLWHVMDVNVVGGAGYEVAILFENVSAV